MFFDLGDVFLDVAELESKILLKLTEGILRQLHVLEAAIQGCIKFLIPVYQVCLGRISSCEEEGENRVCGEEYNAEKRARGSNIIFSKIFRLLERISN